MAGDFRVAIDFLDHPKTVRLKVLVGAEGVFCLMRLWAFAGNYRPRGRLSRMKPQDIAIAAKWTEDSDLFVSALVDSGFLDKLKNGLYRLHNWKQRQGYLYHKPERQERARKGGKAKHRVGNNLRKNHEVKNGVCSPLISTSKNAFSNNTQRSTPSMNRNDLPEDQRDSKSQSAFQRVKRQSASQNEKAGKTKTVKADNDLRSTKNANKHTPLPLPLPLPSPSPKKKRREEKSSHAGTKSPHDRLQIWIKSEEGISWLRDQVDIFGRDFVSHELKKAGQWVKDFPKRANYKNWKRYLGGWFGRADESRQKRTGPEPLKPGDKGYLVPD